ncbi:ACT domain-containing protein ACR9-like [Chenopodium quinoa]|uniref:ACT domain-containing protein ACR9-like n=1 Tax=Chenopodium quinoa TaxID=63459 RepID=UPI000B76DE12|nr:ACT domain-containing protein ACR9-like [Chenopodium quinoa]
MGIPNDDTVSIERGKKSGDPWVITVNCPDKSGLGLDICRTILDFGLFISKGDVSTDGKWCYVVLWVVPHSSTYAVRWENLKERLVSFCPSCSLSFYYTPPPPSKSSAVYLLKFCCLDRRGLLYDVTHVLCELELNIERVKVTTTPDDRVLDLFFITDNLELLHTKERQGEAYERLRCVLGESCISCELQLADSHHEARKRTSSISPAVAEELFASEYSKKECHMQALSADLTLLKKAAVNVDNSLSPSHTLFQIHCVDHKGLIYDIMRTLKDHDVKISYGRIPEVTKGHRDIDLFLQQKDGKKILDPEREYFICSCLKMEMLHPLRVLIVNRGPDTELLVANPVESSGRGRPRVFHDATLALKKLGICIFSAEIGRYSASDREWEVYRFLLDENCEYQLTTTSARNQIVDRVRRLLMGW